MLETIVAWVFLLWGVYKIINANSILEKSFIIFDYSEFCKRTGKDKNYLDLSQEVQLHSVTHAISMLLFYIWIIVGSIWGNSMLYVYMLIFHTLSGMISRTFEPSSRRQIYVIWYAIYWGIFILFNAKIIGLF